MAAACPVPRPLNPDAALNVGDRGVNDPGCSACLGFDTGGHQIWDLRTRGGRRRCSQGQLFADRSSGDPVAQIRLFDSLTNPGEGGQAAWKNQ